MTKKDIEDLARLLHTEAVRWCKKNPLKKPAVYAPAQSFDELEKHKQARYRFVARAVLKKLGH